MAQTVDGVLNIAGEIVLVTGVLVLVSHPETVKIFGTIGSTFVNALKAASGQTAAATAQAKINARR
jgi:Na+/serine symporter